VKQFESEKPFSWAAPASDPIADIQAAVEACKEAARRPSPVQVEIVSPGECAFRKVLYNGGTLEDALEAMVNA
jgi:hypothetical protein